MNEKPPEAWRSEALYRYLNDAAFHYRVERAAQLLRLDNAGVAVAALVLHLEDEHQRIGA